MPKKSVQQVLADITMATYTCFNSKITVEFLGD